MGLVRSGWEVDHSPRSCVPGWPQRRSSDEPGSVVDGEPGSVVDGEPAPGRFERDLRGEADF
jgi:hypothetical protein